MQINIHLPIFHHQCFMLYKYIADDIPQSNSGGFLHRFLPMLVPSVVL